MERSLTPIPDVSMAEDIQISSIVHFEEETVRKEVLKNEISRVGIIISEVHINRGVVIVHFVHFV